MQGSQSKEEFMGEDRYHWINNIHEIFQVEDNVELLKYSFGEFLITAILVTVFLRLFPMKLKRLPANDKERQEAQNRKYIHALFVGLAIVALTGIRWIFTDRVRSTREGNVLTRVCPSICLSTLGVGHPNQVQVGSTPARSSRGGGVPQPGPAQGVPHLGYPPPSDLAGRFPPAGGGVSHLG